MNSSLRQVLSFLLLSITILARGSNILFEENKNQWPSQVKFQADIPGGKIFLEKNTFTFLYQENIDWHGKYRNESAGPVRVKRHSYKVNFENTQAHAVVSGNNRQEGHRNYYLGNDPQKWAESVALFSAVYYKDLYPNIDMKVYNAEANLKYDLIVHAGGDPTRIKLNYTGTDGMYIENGHLFIKTSIYNFIEQRPYAYQEKNGRRKQVACSYVLEQNSLSFAVGKFDPTLPLIIDPTLIASTYSGSTADNWGFCSTYDAAGNIYMGGTISGTGYPTTVGAHDASYNGGTYNASPPTVWPFDIILAKFNPTGTQLLYATYYGGITNEQPNSLVVNSANELYVVGRTNSNNFPTLNAYDASHNGFYDIIVGKFNSTGGLIGSTYVGGTYDDCVNYNIGWDGANAFGATKFSFGDDSRSDIVLDNNSDVYVTACTRSTNFPVTAGTLSGLQDAVVFKMSGNLSALTWSTFLGGSSFESGNGLKLDNNGNIYVTGGTTSTNFPTTAGALNQTYQGGLADGFVAVLNSSGTALLRSTYLGTSAYDQSFFIDLDASADIYLFGQTQGAYPFTTGVYTNPNSGQFIHKLKSDLSATLFSTVIGNGPASGTPNVNISPSAFRIDSCQAIYLAGWGRSSVLSAMMPFPSSTTGLPTTANALQTATDGKDYYIATLSPGATGLTYATFFGEGAANPDADHIDGGSARFDENGILYHAACASCGGTQGFPVMPGAYSSTNNSNHINYPLPTSPSTPLNNCNEAVFKMDLSGMSGAQAKANIIGLGNGCVLPFTVQFDNSGSFGTDFIWDFGDGATSTMAAPAHSYTAVGTYTVTLFAIDSAGACGFMDTDNLTVTVGSLTLLANTQNIICAGTIGSATVTPQGGQTPFTYTWNTSPVQTTAIATGLTAGNYTVTVSDAIGCTGSKVVNIIQIAPLSLSITITDASACTASDGSLSTVISGGTSPFTFAWSTGSSASAIAALAPGSYSVLITDANGCTQTKNATVACPTGTGELFQHSSIAIYPNPTSGLVSISFPLNTTEITLTDILGQEVYHSYVLPTDRSHTIDLSRSPAGMYLLEIKSVTGVTVQKIIRE